MSYTEVFIYCYSAFLIVMFIYLFGRLFIMSRRLLQVGSGAKRTAVFFTGQLPGTLAVWLWSSFLFGTVAGAAWSAILWVTS